MFPSHTNFFPLNVLDFEQVVLGFWVIRDVLCFSCFHLRHITIASSQKPHIMTHDSGSGLTFGGSDKTIDRAHKLVIRLSHRNKLMEQATRRHYANNPNVVFVYEEDEILDDPDYWVTIAERANIPLTANAIEQPSDLNNKTAEIQSSTAIVKQSNDGRTLLETLQDRYKAYQQMSKEDEDAYYAGIEQEYKIQKERSRQAEQNEKSRKQRISRFYKQLKANNLINTEIVVSETESESVPNSRAASISLSDNESYASVSPEEHDYYHHCDHETKELQDDEIPQDDSIIVLSDLEEAEAEPENDHISEHNDSELENDSEHHDTNEYSNSDLFGDESPMNSEDNEEGEDIAEESEDIEQESELEDEYENLHNLSSRNVRYGIQDIGHHNVDESEPSQDEDEEEVSEELESESIDEEDQEDASSQQSEGELHNYSYDNRINPGGNIFHDFYMQQNADIQKSAETAGDQESFVNLDSESENFNEESAPEEEDNDEEMKDEESERSEEDEDEEILIGADGNTNIPSELHGELDVNDMAFAYELAKFSQKLNDLPEIPQYEHIDEHNPVEKTSTASPSYSPVSPRSPSRTPSEPTDEMYPFPEEYDAMMEEQNNVNASNVDPTLFFSAIENSTVYDSTTQPLDNTNLLAEFEIATRDEIVPPSTPIQRIEFKPVTPPSHPTPEPPQLHLGLAGLLSAALNIHSKKSAGESVTEELVDTAQKLTEDINADVGEIDKAELDNIISTSFYEPKPALEGAKKVEVEVDEPTVPISEDTRSDVTNLFEAIEIAQQAEKMQELLDAAEIIKEEEENAEELAVDVEEAIKEQEKGIEEVDQEIETVEAATEVIKEAIETAEVIQEDVETAEAMEEVIEAAEVIEEVIETAEVAEQVIEATEATEEAVETAEADEPNVTIEEPNAELRESIAAVAALATGLGIEVIREDTHAPESEQIVEAIVDEADNELSEEIAGEVAEELIKEAIEEAIEEVVEETVEEVTEKVADEATIESAFSAIGGIAHDIVDEKVETEDVMDATEHPSEEEDEEEVKEITPLVDTVNDTEVDATEYMVVKDTTAAPASREVSPSSDNPQTSESFNVLSESSAYGLGKDSDEDDTAEKLNEEHYITSLLNETLAESNDVSIVPLASGVYGETIEEYGGQLSDGDQSFYVHEEQSSGSKENSEGEEVQVSDKEEEVEEVEELNSEEVISELESASDSEKSESESEYGALEIEAQVEVESEAVSEEESAFEAEVEASKPTLKRSHDETLDEEENADANTSIFKRVKKFFSGFSPFSRAVPTKVELTEEVSSEEPEVEESSAAESESEKESEAESKEKSSELSEVESSEAEAEVEFDAKESESESEPVEGDAPAFSQYVKPSSTVKENTIEDAVQTPSKKSWFSYITAPLSDFTSGIMMEVEDSSSESPKQPIEIDSQSDYNDADTEEDEDDNAEKTIHIDVQEEDEDSETPVIHVLEGEESIHEGNQTEMITVLPLRADAEGNITEIITIKQSTPLNEDDEDAEMSKMFVIGEPHKRGRSASIDGDDEPNKRIHLDDAKLSAPLPVAVRTRSRSPSRKSSETSLATRPEDRASINVIANRVLSYGSDDDPVALNEDQLPRLYPNMVEEADYFIEKRPLGLGAFETNTDDENEEVVAPVKTEVKPEVKEEIPRTKSGRGRRKVYPGAPVRRSRRVRADEIEIIDESMNDDYECELVSEIVLPLKPKRKYTRKNASKKEEADVNEETEQNIDAAKNEETEGNEKEVKKEEVEQKDEGEIREDTDVKEKVDHDVDAEVEVEKKEETETDEPGVATPATVTTTAEATETAETDEAATTEAVETAVPDTTEATESIIETTEVKTEEVEKVEPTPPKQIEEILISDDDDKEVEEKPRKEYYLDEEFDVASPEDDDSDDATFGERLKAANRGKGKSKSTRGRGRPRGSINKDTPSKRGRGGKRGNPGANRGRGRGGRGRGRGRGRGKKQLQ